MFLSGRNVPAPGGSGGEPFFPDAVRTVPDRQERTFLPACIPLRPCVSAYQAHCALRVLARFAGEKTKGETAAQCRPAERERRDGVFCRETTGRRVYVKRFKEKLQRNKAGLERRPFVPARQGISSLQGVFSFCRTGTVLTGQAESLAWRLCSPAAWDKGHGVWSEPPARGMGGTGALACGERKRFPHRSGQDRRAGRCPEGGQERATFQAATGGYCRKNKNVKGVDPNGQRPARRKRILCEKSWRKPLDRAGSP